MKKALSILLALMMLMSVIPLGIISASAEEEHIHAFGRNGKCACGVSFSPDDYQPVKGIAYSETFCFTGAEKLLFLASSVGTDIHLTDKNGKETIYGEGRTDGILIDGDTLTVTAEKYKVWTKTKTGNGPTVNRKVDEIAFRLEAIVPIYDANAVTVVAPTCLEEGYSSFTCDGKQYLWDIVPEKGHSFDKNGVCTGCKVHFSDLSCDGGENLSFGDRVYFEGADKILVTIRSKGCDDFSVSLSYKYYDSNGNEKASKFVSGNGSFDNNGYHLLDDENPATVLVDGDYVRVVAPVAYRQYSEYYEFFPLYNANKTVSGGKSVYTYGGKSYQIDSGLLTGSVLSEGNMWIVIVVAVLVVLGAAALIIVKKKKKPATANGASTEDEE